MSDWSINPCVHGEVAKNCGICEEMHALENKVKSLEQQVKDLHELAFMCGPGEFSPDGWTYKQQCTRDKERIAELEVHCDFLSKKLSYALKKLEQYE